MEDITVGQLLNKLGTDYTNNSAKYADVLYPKILLAVYGMTIRGEFVGGNPEQFCDQLLQEFVEKVEEKDAYIKKLRESMLLDDKIRDCAVLRLNYAALLEEGVDTITICTGQRKELSCQDGPDMVVDEEGQQIYAGKSPSEFSLAEIDKKSDEFYINKRVIQENPYGLPEDKRAYIAEKICELGCEFIDDREIVYERLRGILYQDYEVAIVGRLIYLLVMKEVHLTIDNQNG